MPVCPRLEAQSRSPDADRTYGKVETAAGTDASLQWHRRGPSIDAMDQVLVAAGARRSAAGAVSLAGSAAPSRPPRYTRSIPAPAGQAGRTANIRSWRATITGVRSRQAPAKNEVLTAVRIPVPPAGHSSAPARQRRGRSSGWRLRSNAPLEPSSEGIGIPRMRSACWNKDDSRATG